MDTKTPAQILKDKIAEIDAQALPCFCDKEISYVCQNCIVYNEFENALARVCEFCEGTGVIEYEDGQKGKCICQDTEPADNTGATEGDR